MRTSTCAALAVLALTSPALAQSAVQGAATATRAATVQPTKLGFVAGAHVYPYAENAIFEGYVTPGFVTDLVLQPGEGLVAVASGDTARWVIGDTTSGSGETKQTHVLVKPFTTGLITNLLITTDRRAYHVRLVSTRGTAMSSMRWSYPHDDLIALARKTEAAKAAAPIASGLAVDQLHFGYIITGDRPRWRPLRVFDDGTRTFIEFPTDVAQGDAPPLFLVNASGAAELVNYRQRERYYVVDRIFDTAELRFGLKKQDVVRLTRKAPGEIRRAP